MVCSAQVKTISADYFRLRKLLDRRIYELCAKHCGKQNEWHISLEILHRKSGSMATLRRFRQAIKELVASNDLPDYRLTYDDKKDMLKVRNRDLSKFLKKSP
ncbi:replication initiator protein A [Neisseria sp. P0001.S009]|uniref:Replication initiator protein A n=2 Tax=Neisseria TaxID=482 RepID=A0ABD7EZZ0_NEIPE|nr:replication initiator protein A [Neisseria perflava]QXW95228.1 replication initiator protein A [Neisseria sicca ATCC 29256]